MWKWKRQYHMLRFSIYFRNLASFSPNSFESSLIVVNFMYSTCIIMKRIKEGLLRDSKDDVKTQNCIKWNCQSVNLALLFRFWSAMGLWSHLHPRFNPFFFQIWLIIQSEDTLAIWVFLQSESTFKGRMLKVLFWYLSSCWSFEMDSPITVVWSICLP